MRACKVDDCDRKHLARGFCNSHYYTVWKEKNGKPCKVDGCESGQRSRGYCGKHYQTWRKQNLGEPCQVADCQGNTYAKGYCRTHYQRLRRIGTVELPKKKPCKVEACEELASSRGWCRRHYLSWYRHGDPLVARTNDYRIDDDGRECTQCGEYQEWENFYPHKNRNIGYTEKCRECFRWERIYYNYQLTRKQWEAMFDQQDGKCDICGITFSDFDISERPEVDHDHDCCDGPRSCGECVRALLCRSCNSNLEREADTNKAFAAYIRKHAELRQTKVCV